MLELVQEVARKLGFKPNCASLLIIVTGDVKTEDEDFVSASFTCLPFGFFAFFFFVVCLAVAGRGVG